MQSFFWQLVNRTPETQFIFNLFHLLLAGLTLLVLLYQLHKSGEPTIQLTRWLLPSGFFLLVVHFAFLSVYFGAKFFFGKELQWAGFDPLPHGLMACAFLLVVGGYLRALRQEKTYLVRWILGGCALVIGVVLADLLVSMAKLPGAEGLHSAVMLVSDLLVLLAVALGLQIVFRAESQGRPASLIALASVGMALVLQNLLLFLPQHQGILAWNAEQHLLSVALFAFAWAAGERSHNLLDRIFVRLNLTFILLASLIMLITAGMEKYQYLRLAEQRSMDLAEFLRGHIAYYQAHGDRLEGILGHPDVLRRVVVEFGRLPELREVNVYLDGERARFQYTQDWRSKRRSCRWPDWDHPMRMGGRRTVSI